LQYDKAKADERRSIDRRAKEATGIVDERITGLQHKPL
jgi:hypothetical protein